jgi:purine-binding chemotaxis protein CheW
MKPDINIDNAAKTEKQLKARAAVLREIPAKAEETQHFMHGTAFLAGYVRYFIESKYITEIQTLSSITPLPGIPAYFSGITNFRGKIMVVVNLVEFLGLHINAITNQNKIIFLEHDGIAFGILADEVTGNLFVDPAGFKMDLAPFIGDNARLFHGILADKTFIINGEALISDKRIFIGEV